MPKLATLIAAMSLAALPGLAQAQPARGAVLSLTPFDAAFLNLVAPEFGSSGPAAGRSLAVGLRQASAEDLPAASTDILRERPDGVAAGSPASLAKVCAASPAIVADPVGFGIGSVVPGAGTDAGRFTAAVLFDGGMNGAARIGVRPAGKAAAGGPDRSAAAPAAAVAHGIVVMTDPVFFLDTPSILGLAVAAGVMQTAIGIIEGCKPCDIRVERPSRLEPVREAAVAKRLRLVLPPDFIARADRLIE